MTNIDLKIFWDSFDRILAEKGEPFKIIHEKSGEQTHWACVNRNKILANYCIDISLIRKDNYLRVGLYIIDKNSDVGRIISVNKEIILRQLSFEPLWMHGIKNPDTLRVIKKINIDDKTNRELIEEALPYITEFINIAEQYGKQYFFDF